MKNERFTLRQIIILLILMPTACSYNRDYFNREMDKNEAEMAVDHFYNFLGQKQYDSAFTCFHPDLWKSKENEKFRNYLKNSNEQLGLILERKLDHWTTRVTIGYQPDTYYALFYIVRYQKKEFKVSIILKQLDDKIKIISYQADPDKFL